MLKSGVIIADEWVIDNMSRGAGWALVLEPGSDVLVAMVVHHTRHAPLLE